MKLKNNILHIVPHAGGGVGAVLRALLTADSTRECRYSHKVASLEYLNEVTRMHCDGHGIPWIDDAATIRREDLSALMNSADIVLTHWWNHPLLMRLLAEGLPAMRLALWSHVNGFFPPQAFISELFEISDRFAFSTKTSITVPIVQKLSEKLKEKLRVIRSCSGIPEGAESIYPKSNPFQAGYIGTVEPIKMHADFLTMCAEASIPSPCIVAGGPAHEELRTRAEAMNLADCFEIIGSVKDPKPLFKELHAFAYPLSPRHYGTGEQVLIEAMAFGAVPVVLANPPEAAIVRHGETGLVAKNAADFTAALRMLMGNPAERDRLAAGGHQFVMEECGIEHSTRAFHELFDEMLSLPKQPRKLQAQPIQGVKNGSPLHLFLTSLGETAERQVFEKAIYHNVLDMIPADFVSKTRGTSFHYLSMLRCDPELEVLCNTVAMNGN